MQVILSGQVSEHELLLVSWFQLPNNTTAQSFRYKTQVEVMCDVQIKEQNAQLSDRKLTASDSHFVSNDGMPNCLLYHFPKYIPNNTNVMFPEMQKNCFQSKKNKRKSFPDQTSIHSSLLLVIHNAYQHIKGSEKPYMRESHLTIFNQHFPNAY